MKRDYHFQTEAVLKSPATNVFFFQNVARPRQVWVESLDEAESSQNKDLIELHPDVWSVKPRLDILWQNVDWQLRYRRVQFDEQKDRQEMHYGGRPWPQKARWITFEFGGLFER